MRTTRPTLGPSWDHLGTLERLSEPIIDCPCWVTTATIPDIIHYQPSLLTIIKHFNPLSTTILTAAIAVSKNRGYLPLGTCDQPIVAAPTGQLILVAEPLNTHRITTLFTPLLFNPHQTTTLFSQHLATIPTYKHHTNNITPPSLTRPSPPHHHGPDLTIHFPMTSQPGIVAGQQVLHKCHELRHVGGPTLAPRLVGAVRVDLFCREGSANLIRLQRVE